MKCPNFSIFETFKFKKNPIIIKFISVKEINKIIFFMKLNIQQPVVMLVMFVVLLWVRAMALKQQLHGQNK